MIKLFQRARLRTCFALAMLASGLGQALMPATALAEPVRQWLLSDSSGQVRLVKSGVTPIALTVGDVFATGDWIETGPEGRAILQRGSETIVVAPNSRIGLPVKNDGPFMTRILHTLGTILLTVDKKASQHFEVRTPYMAAVVKGTTFTVGIQGQRAVVHVVEGLVEVQNLTSGLSGLVRPGQTGSVFRNRGPGVSIDGAQPGTGAATPASPTPGPAQESAVEPDSQLAAQEPATPLAETVSTAQPGSVVVTEALGPSDINLAAATGGLVREVAPDGVSAAKGSDGGASMPIATDTASASLSMPNDLATTLVFNGTTGSTPTGTAALEGVSLGSGAPGGSGGGGGGGPPPIVPDDG